ncbi:hypothetical protein KRX54_02495 [Actinomycetaceae bacterium TAE3-ERU4]|nr:hypothetical protein [Actinomycetaceae bacterium TAE3-ERU4]
MTRRIRTIVSVLVAFVVASAMVAGSLALAGEKYLKVAVIGDSYSAGNGAGNYYGPSDSYRSTRNWAHVYSNWLNDNGVRTTLHNHAYSNAVSQDVVDKQIDKIEENSNVVMLTIGGNDVSFAKIVANCFLVAYRSESSCKRSIESADKLLPTVRERTLNLLEKVSKRLPQNSKIVLVGYPLLSTDKVYTIPGWFFSSDWDAAKAVRNLGIKASDMQKDMIDEWNQKNAIKATFVPTRELFAGHEPDPATDARNDKRWINEFLETEGKVGENGITTSKEVGLTHAAMFYHPNITGHEKIGEELAKVLGIVDVTESSETVTGPIDVVFVIDGGQDNDAKQVAVKGYVNEVIKKFQDGGAQVRYSLLTSAEGNYTKIALTDSLSADKLKEDVAKEVSSSVATNLTPAKGLAVGLEQDWRSPARKLIYYIGNTSTAAANSSDAPNWEELLRRTYDKGSVEVHLLNTDLENASDEGLAKLARHTAGTVQSLAEKPDLPPVAIGTVETPKVEPSPEAPVAIGTVEAPKVEPSPEAPVAIGTVEAPKVEPSPEAPVVIGTVNEENGNHVVVKPGKTPEASSPEELTPYIVLLSEHSAMGKRELTAHRNDEVTVMVEGFKPGKPVSFELHSKVFQLGTVTADAKGAATLTFRVPKEISFGLHSVQAVQDGTRAGVPLIISKRAENPAKETPKPGLKANSGNEKSTSKNVDTNQKPAKKVLTSDGEELARTGTNDVPALLFMSTLLAFVGIVMVAVRKRART